ncbi:hypothetical protein JAAARDRAFT_53154 [Jaapia argillacea MUCL 33604]|uniref:Uncharacterized protein n=1 Tax=Jaapia argillacea MUCL 33604 TaxID=933084 RepID=A0A067QK23_9AGAM|nr:hypothetical protein JAAARDRAFT_53154 [Jaapia argillacea MUCL 33604]
MFFPVTARKVWLCHFPFQGQKIIQSLKPAPIWKDLIILYSHLTFVSAPHFTSSAIAVSIGHCLLVPSTIRRNRSLPQSGWYSGAGWRFIVPRFRQELSFVVVSSVLVPSLRSGHVEIYLQRAHTWATGTGASADDLGLSIHPRFLEYPLCSILHNSQDASSKSRTSSVFVFLS